MNAHPEPNVYSAACPSRHALLDMTGRWGSLTLTALLDGALRFGEIKRHVEGISDRMLAQTLTQLERDGLVTRTVHRLIPPHVEYALTTLGREVAEPLATLIHLLESRLDQVLAAQRAYDAHPEHAVSAP